MENITFVPFAPVWNLLLSTNLNLWRNPAAITGLSWEDTTQLLKPKQQMRFCPQRRVCLISINSSSALSSVLFTGCRSHFPSAKLHIACRSRHFSPLLCQLAEPRLKEMIRAPRRSQDANCTKPFEVTLEAQENPPEGISGNDTVCSPFTRGHAPNGYTKTTKKSPQINTLWRGVQNVRDVTIPTISQYDNTSVRKTGIFAILKKKD